LNDLEFRPVSNQSFVSCLSFFFFRSPPRSSSFQCRVPEAFARSLFTFQTFSVCDYFHALFGFTSFRFYAVSRSERHVKMISRRKHNDSGHGYVDPSLELNLGLWILFAGATAFLALRIWIKITRRHGLWWDDHILLVSWVSTSGLRARVNRCLMLTAP